MEVREGRCRRCKVVFYLCRPCGRGQTYCGASCRALSRTDDKRAARARHQRTDHGRQDHRDRNRAYRERKRRLGVRVMDQGPPKLAPVASFCSAVETAPTSGTASSRPGEKTHGLSARTATVVAGMARCAVCGHASRFIRRNRSRGDSEL